MKIETKPYSQAPQLITEVLNQQLAYGPTLLLLSGGSAAGVYEKLAQQLQLDLEPGQLVVGLVDERYDLDPTHAEANAKLITDTGLVTHLEQLGAIFSPILHGHSFEEEVAQYNYQLAQFMLHERRQVVAILGIGPDGHIAGILPDNDADAFKQRFDNNLLVAGYHNEGPFPQRITLTFTALRQVDSAVVLIKDPRKLPLVTEATDPDRGMMPNLMPATIIQDMKEVFLAVPEPSESVLPD